MVFLNITLETLKIISLLFTFIGSIGAMGKASFAVLGVIVGWGLKTLTEWYITHRKSRKDIEYLSINIAILLEKFILNCMDVTYDDGKPDGQTDPKGATPTVELPIFDPKSVDVEWKVLPPKLMYEILSIPLEIINIKRSISIISEYVASFPDYDEIFEERIYEFSKLGIKSLEILRKLRKIGKVPEGSLVGSMHMAHFKDEIEKINQLRQNRHKFNQEFMNK